MTARSESLRRFGYTAREAEFLELAGLLSGYFVVGQFNRFIERKSGALGQAFFERSIHLGHIRKAHSDARRHVFQITASSVYEALGDRNNRNRREHQLGTVRRRLMALDYCIAQRGSYLLTEAEKLAYFRKLGVAEEKLPQESFGSAKRFFVDKQPLEVRPGGQTVLVYVDDDCQGTLAWTTFLKAHRELVRALQGVSLTFATADSARFLAAERAFSQVITGGVQTGGIDRNRLERYFAARRRFDARDFASFDQSSLDRFREDRKVFADEEIEKRYRDWLVMGTPALEGLRQAAVPLSLVVLPSRYDWLRPFQIHERRVSHALDLFPAKANSRGNHRQDR